MNHRYQIILWVIVGILVIIGIFVFTQKGSVQTACTEEALMCPDGSAVGRTGPLCEFSPCTPMESMNGELIYSNFQYFLKTKSPSSITPEEYIVPLAKDDGLDLQSFVGKTVSVRGSFTWGNTYDVASIEFYGDTGTVVIPDQNNQNELSCTKTGGNWDGEFLECLGIDSTQCASIGGVFNECASACRNDPNATVCTLQCVQVCKL